jgi:predicted DNA-binding ribbon-helix-helix protein
MFTQTADESAASIFKVYHEDGGRTSVKLENLYTKPLDVTAQ